MYADNLIGNWTQQFLEPFWLVCTRKNRFGYK